MVTSPKEEPVIRMQIVERPGAKLFNLLKRAMRSGDLRTFSLEKRGTRVVHNRYPGYMNWTNAGGIIACEIRSPKNEAEEWQLLSAVVGRLAHRFPEFVESVNIQLAAPPPVSVKRRRKR
jgi:hypothetical protein